MQFNGKDINDKYIGLYEFMDYIEERILNAHKVWISQDYMDTLEKVYEYLNLLDSQGLLTKEE